MAAAAGVLEKIELSVIFPRLVRCGSRLCAPSPGRSPSRITASFLAMMGDLRDDVSTAGNSLVTALALPDTDSLALDGVLSAESADVAGVLGDFHLLHLLTQGGTVSVGKLLESVSSCRSIRYRLCLDRNHSRVGAKWANVIPGTIFTGDADLCGN